MKRRNRKRGFTLVEMCIVIALIGTAVTMATGFLIVYHKDVAAIDTKETMMSDINTLRTQINNWIDQYDTYAGTSTINKGSYCIYCQDYEEIKSKLTVNNKKITLEKGSDKSEIAVESITHCEFSFDAKDSAGNENCVLRCKAYLTDSSCVELLFAIPSQVDQEYWS